MAVNLATKYSDKIASRCVRDSVIAGRLSQEYSFSGAKSVKIYTPVTAEMNDYNRAGVSNRYGTPAEMQDNLQEMTVGYDRSFTLVIDKGNNLDQMNTKEAGRMLGLQIREKVVPDMDKKVLARLAEGAGIKSGSATDLSKSNIVERIATGTQQLDDAEIPDIGRTLYVSATAYKFLRLSDEFQKSERLLNRSLTFGEVGQFDNMPVVKVPAGRWPEGVNFMIVYKNSATAPVKINDAKVHKDPPGFSGSLLEGRVNFDAFVIGARASGVYIDFDSDVKGMCATPTQSGGTFASTTAGASFLYTADGSDPRYSATAVAAASESEASGTTIKVCCSKAGLFCSDVLTYTA